MPAVEAEVNHWHDDRCAKAFWDQKHATPYRELLDDTAALLDPKPGERWLDLGCGGGQLTSLLWRLGGGTLGGVVAADCAAANAGPVEKLAAKLGRGASERVTFRVADLSDGLPWAESASFDGIVSGLAMSYAESRDPVTGAYTDAAYRRLFAEAARVLRPGGRLVFSVNVPRPKFWSVFWKSLGGGVPAHAGRVILNALRMQRYGAWLKREAAKGRFHFLPLDELKGLVEAGGLRVESHRVSYAGQAFVIRAVKS